MDYRKYLPEGVIWKGKYISNTNLYKVCEYVNDFLKPIESEINQSYRFMDDITYWDAFFNLPNNIFYKNFKDLNKYYYYFLFSGGENTVEKFVDLFKNLGITVNIIENRENLFRVEVESDIPEGEVLGFAYNLSYPLQGSGITFLEQASGFAQRFLAVYLPPTVEYEVLQKEKI